MRNSAIRGEYILQELMRTGSVEVEALAHSLGVDSSTIRRDLERLERQQVLRRVHGGAIPLEAPADAVYAYDLNFQDNLGRQVPEKLRIAQAALKLIRAGDTISISPGTTTTYLARAIRQAPIPNLTIVTNAVNIAMELSGIPQVTLVLTGGMILPSFFALVGPMAEQNLRELHTDKAFVGMHGVSSSYGLTGPNQLEALTYRAAMERTRETIVLADQTKIGQVALYRIAPITTMRRLLTAHGADAGELEQMRTLGIAVVEC